MDLNGKVAIVTGAGSGIGYSIAEHFAAAGASVCVNYLGYEDDAKALALRLPRAIAVKADVSKVVDVQAMVETTSRSSAPSTCLSTTRGSRGRCHFWTSTRRPGTS